MLEPNRTLPLVILLLFTILISLTIVSFPLKTTLLLFGGIIILVVAFLSTEAALYILIFSMLLSPEFVVAELGEGATAARGVTLRLDDLLLVIIGISWFARTAIYEELGLFRKTPLNRPIAVFMTVCIISTMFGALMGRVRYITGFFFVLKYFEFFIVYFMAANFIRRERQVKNFIIAILVTAAVVSIIGLSQIPLDVDRISAPFEGEEGEPNTFGGYLVLMLALVGGIFMNIENRVCKVLLLILGILLFVTFLFTLSRSSYIAIIPMYLTVLFLSEKRMLLAVVLLLSLVAAPFLLPQPVKERVTYTFTEPKQRGQVAVGSVHFDLSTSERLQSWHGVLKDWTKHPLLGYGVTGYHFVDAQYVRVLAETGLIGLLVFLWFIYLIFKEILNNYKRCNNKFQRGLLQGVIAGTMALVFHSIGANSFFIVRIMEPYYFLLAIAITLPQLKNV